MSKAKVIAKATFWITFLALISKGIGLIRESSIAALYGASSDSDAYKLALTAPGIFFSIISGAIAQVFIPIYEERKKEGKESELYFLNNTLTVVVFISVILSLIGILSSPWVIKFIAPGIDQATYSKAVYLTQIYFPSSIFLVMAAVATGFLQTNGNFIIPGLQYFPNNLIVIASCIFLSRFGIQWVALGSVIAVASMFIFQMPSLSKLGWKYRPILNFRDKSMVKIYKLVIPTVAGTAFSQISCIIDKILASNQATGTISALDYAQKIDGIVYSIIAGSLITVLYPEMAKAETDQKRADIVSQSIRIAFIFTVPLAFMMFISRESLVRILFQRGSFKYEDTLMTAAIFAGFTINVAASPFREIYNRAFYAMQDTKTPMINTIFAMSINIVLSLVLSKFYGPFGISLGTSLAVVISGVTLMIRFKVKTGISKIKESLNALIGAIVGSLITVTAIIIAGQILQRYYKFKESFTETLLSFVVMWILGVLFYIIWLFISKNRELKMLISNVINRRAKI